MNGLEYNTREVYPGQDKIQLRKDGSYQNYLGHNNILFVPFEKGYNIPDY